MNEIIDTQSPIDSRNTAISEASFIRRRAALLRISPKATDLPRSARLAVDFKVVPVEVTG
jgi:hypothetical protein